MATELRHRAVGDGGFVWLQSWRYGFFGTSLIEMPNALATPSP